LTNCTLANNMAINGLNISGATGQATALGGGIYSLGELSLTNVTVAGNSVSATVQGSGTAVAQGGGIYVSPYYPHGGLLVNTIVAGNSSTMQGPDAFGPFASLGHNLVGKTDGSNGWIASDLTGTVGNPLNAMLGTLGNHGGPTQTIPLQARSPALDAGDPNYAPPTDQRGVPRAATPNIGAYEATAVSFLVSGPVNVTAGQPFNVSVTAVDPYGETAAGYTGTVDLTSSDDQAPFLGEYTFTLADGGQYTFSGVVLYTSGLQTITATDNGGLAGSYVVLVQDGAETPHTGASNGATQAASQSELATVPTHDVHPLATEPSAPNALAANTKGMDSYFLVLADEAGDALRGDAHLVPI
jgi:hypothetical protein